MLIVVPPQIFSRKTLLANYSWKIIDTADIQLRFLDRKNRTVLIFSDSDITTFICHKLCNLAKRKLSKAVSNGKANVFVRLDELIELVCMSLCRGDKRVNCFERRKW